MRIKDLKYDIDVDKVLDVLHHLTELFKDIKTEKGLDMDVVMEISTLIDVISDKMWFLR